MSSFNMSFQMILCCSLIAALITGILDTFMLRLNMGCQMLLLWKLFATLITGILDTFMFWFFMFSQITLISILLVTLATSKLYTIICCSNFLEGYIVFSDWPSVLKQSIKISESKCRSREVLLKWKCSSLQNSRQHWTTLPNVNWSYLHLETIKSRSAWKKLGFYWNFSSKVEGGNLLDQERYCASKFVDHYIMLSE